MDVLNFRLGGAVLIAASSELTSRGLTGIQLQKVVKMDKANLPVGFISLFTRTVDRTIFSAQSTLIGLYRLIQGNLSFRKSVSGPVKIFAIAAKTVEDGWGSFWFLLANITIILGIMNLLPIPVLDGGHIVFYLIEALYKPLKPSIIAASTRIGMMLMLSLGVYVIVIDLIDVFINRMFF